MMILVAALILPSFGFAQDKQDAVDLADARERADAARRKCASLIAGTDGLTSIGMAGTGTDYKLLLVVRDPVVKKAIQDRLGGDRCDSIPILWSVKNPSATAAVPPPVPETAAAPEVAPDFTDPNSLDCRRHRWWGPTYVWTYTPPGWCRPWIVWEYNNGWNGHKLHRRYYGWYYRWR